jgi:hypothetical protein
VIIFQDLIRFPLPYYRALLDGLGRAKRAEKVTGTFLAINKFSELYSFD